MFHTFFLVEKTSKTTIHVFTKMHLLAPFTVVTQWR